MGSANLALGDYRSAILYHEQALEIARQIGDRWGEAAYLGNLGIVCKNIGELRKALSCFEEALEIARQIGDQRIEGACIGNLGSN